MRDGTPCLICNTWHKGIDPLVTGHDHQDSQGVGYVRLNLTGSPEFCWRCGCTKSGWINLPNEISDHCAVAGACVCHTAGRAH